MDDPQGATRVEIELTPNDDSRLRRRKSPAEAADLVAHDHGTEPPAVSPELEAQLPPGSGSPPTTIERRKLVVGAAAVAIVALFVGWALGRSGGSSASEDAQPEATTATAAATTTSLRRSSALARVSTGAGCPSRSGGADDAPSE